MRFASAFLALAICAATQSPAQTVDHWTPAQILAQAAQLEPQAHGTDGTASAKLTEYPNHYTMVALRHKNGGAEIHDTNADFFYVVKGRATLLTGGPLQDEKLVGPGEHRGTAVQGGTRTPLNKGDVVHIPAGVSHQLLIPSGSTFVYFVIKVKEK